MVTSVKQTESLWVQNLHRDLASFQTLWLKEATQLGLRLGPNEKVEKLTLYSLAANPANVLKGVIGGLFYDLTQSSYGREFAQVLTAETMAVVSHSDDVIDKRRNISKLAKTRVLDDLLKTITTGNPLKSDIASVTALGIVCEDIYKRISKAKKPELFFEEYAKLASAAKLQLQGFASLELSMEIGARSIGVFAIIPYCFNPNLPSRLLDSARIFGEYCQLLDDSNDWPEDLRDRVKTFATVADPIKRTRLIDGARKLANERYLACLNLVLPAERSLYKTLDAILNVSRKSN